MNSKGDGLKPVPFPSLRVIIPLAQDGNDPSNQHQQHRAQHGN